MLSTWSSRARSLAWGRVTSSILSAVFLAVMVILCLINVDKPRTFASIEGRTEILEFRVFNPELSIIHGSGFKISSWPGNDLDLENKCIEGATRPGVMASVTYQRIGDDRLLITINGKGEWRRSDSDVRSFDGELVLYSDSSDLVDTEEACGNASTRLPIWGPGRIGAPLAMRSDGPGPILLQGELLTYGTTTGLFRSDGGALYQAGEPITLPSGSYLDSIGSSNPEAEPVPVEQTAMFGYVSVSEQPGLGIVVTTDTPYLQLTKPGARENSSRIEVGLFAQVVNDPSIFILQFFFVLIGLFWPIGIDLVGLATSKDEKSDNGDQKMLRVHDPEKAAGTLPPPQEGAA